VENKECLLSLWIEDQNQQNIPLSLLVIQAKAKSLYANLKRDQGEGSQRLSQQVEDGWFDRFKIHNFKMPSEATSADTGHCGLNVSMT
uniref:HTH CENPB-type domain-containing protein n=1 Tax=Gopherus agassizii TaxID=38772 RepID=A0A452GRK3_9SAUR